MATIETVYLNHDNEIQLSLLEDGAPATGLDAVTRVTITIAGTVVDSAVSGQTGCFDLSEIGNAVIALKLGGLNLTPTGAGRTALGELVFYMPAYPAGIVWGFVKLKII